MVLPAGLVLLRAAVMVDRHHLGALLPGGRGQVERGLAHPAAHLQERPTAGGGQGGPVQGLALGRGHEAGGRLGGGEQGGGGGHARENRRTDVVHP